MRFETPCQEGWDVLVGVVNALEVQLGEAEFEEAIATLCTHLEQWPDALRTLPTCWYGALFDEHPSPKLALVQSLRVSMDAAFRKPAMKAHSRWVERLSRAPQIAHFRELHITGLGALKHTHKAALALLRGVEPDTLRLDASEDAGAAFQALLDVQGIEIDVERFEEPPRTLKVTMSSDLQSKHLMCKVDSLTELEALLAIEDLDHVVSLSIVVNFMAPRGDDVPSTLDVSPARFTSLRHLTIAYQGKNHKGDQLVHRAILEWLQHARPVHVANKFFTRQAVELGLYERAYHAEVEFDDEIEKDEILDLVSNPRLNAQALSLGNYQGRVALALADLIDACHDTLAKNLRVWRWPATLEDFKSAQDRLSRLPNLSLFALVAPDMHFEARRGPYLEALESLDAFHDLARMELYARNFGIPEPFKNGEIKALNKLPGSPGDMLTQDKLD